MNILYLAFDHSHSIKNGANEYTEWILSVISRDHHVTFLNQQGAWLFSDGGWVGLEDWCLSSRGRIEAFSRMFSHGEGYFQARLFPVNAINKARNYIANLPDIVIVNFMHSYFALKRELASVSGPIFIVTHNFDLDIYNRWRGGGVAQNIAALLSIGRYRRGIQMLPGNVRLASISQADSHAYSAIATQVRSLHFPAGAKSCAVVRYPSECQRTLKFAFLGSLNTPFNIEGLQYLRDTIFPRFSASHDVEIHIFGSNPESSVVNMIRQCGWQLHANLSDQELEDELVGMTAGILPFAYTQGTKVKVWKFLALGVPILGTSVFEAMRLPREIFYCGDDFENWPCRAAAFTRDASKAAHLMWQSERDSAASLIRDMIVV